MVLTGLRTVVIWELDVEPCRVRSWPSGGWITRGLEAAAILSGIDEPNIPLLSCVGGDVAMKDSRFFSLVNSAGRDVSQMRQIQVRISHMLP
jgi:hypothetical protein